jgi:hypothetical protein
VALLELFVAVLVVGVSMVNSAVPAAAWARHRDGRFLLLSLSNLLLAVVGAIWVWGQWPGSPPGYALVQLPILGLVFLATVAVLAATLLRPAH